MSTTASLQGVQAPSWVTDNQSQRQLSRRSSKLEGGATNTQGQVMPLLEEKTYYQPRTWENLFMIGLLFRLLKCLLDVVLLRRSQQSDSDRLAHPQPERRPGIHTSIGNRNERSGNIRRTGNFTITYKMGTVPESGLAEGLDGLAKNLLAVSAGAGHDNIDSAGVEDSAGMAISLE